MLNFNRKWSRMRINGHDCVDAVGYMKRKGLVMALSRAVDGFQVFK